MVFSSPGAKFIGVANNNALPFLTDIRCAPGIILLKVYMPNPPFLVIASNAIVNSCPDSSTLSLGIIAIFTFAYCGVGGAGGFGGAIGAGGVTGLTGGGCEGIVTGWLAGTRFI